MSKLDKQAYQDELKRVARNLGLPTRGDIEAIIIRHCLRRVDEWVKVHGKPETLTDLQNLFAASLDLEFAEIHDDSEIDSLLRRIPPTREPVMACIPTELDDTTDGVTVKRSRCQPGDRRLLAVVNCRSWHGLRIFFTKWHEAVHCILEGQQLRMAMRKTRAKRPEPEEVLVDRVAAELAFYPPIFRPVMDQELLLTGNLTFGGIDRVRQGIAPEASFTSTAIASLRYCNQPTWFLTCGLGHKRDLVRRISSKQGSLLPLPEPELRVRAIWSSPAASESGIRFFPNMRVPKLSTVAHAFYDEWVLTQEGTERLETWETSSSGPVGVGEIEVEAFKRSDEAWALLRLVG